MSPAVAIRARERFPLVQKRQEVLAPVDGYFLLQTPPFLQLTRCFFLLLVMNKLCTMQICSKKPMNTVNI